MKKKRVIVRLKEGRDYSSSFELIKDKNVYLKKVYTFHNDPFEIERENALETIQNNKSIYESQHYRILGQKQKEYYRTFKIDFEDEISAKNYCNEFKKDENIESSYIDGLVNLCFSPNDNFLNKQFSLFKLKCQEAWDISNGNPKVIISVIDTGIFDEHIDIKNNIFVNKDGKKGFDFTNATTLNDSFGGNGHGTGVAGIIAASWNNNEGITGIAPNCRVLNCKVFPTDDSTAFLSDCQNAIKVSIDNGAKIINCSWEIIDDKDSEAVIDFAQFVNNLSNQVVFVFAAGNSKLDIQDTAWSKLENCLIVGALTKNDFIWIDGSDGSNFGKNVIYSYGADIFGLTKVLNDPYDFLDAGTSFAAPHVAGICALILSYNINISSKQVREIIINSREKVIGLTPSKGLGKVNALNALNLTKDNFAQVDVPFL